VSEVKAQVQRQCSGSEGKIRKSELCSGTAEEVLYILWFNGGKQCSGVEGKISK